MINEKIYEFSIEGMSCTACSSRVEKGLLNTQEVSRAVVNFATRSAVVQTTLDYSEIEKIIRQIGYRALPVDGSFDRQEREKKEQGAAKWRVIWALLLATPVMVLGMMHSLSGEVWARALGGLLTAILLFGPGHQFFAKAFRLLLLKTANMDTLVALGAGLSFVWSLFQTIRSGEHVYFETAAAIIAFVLVGKFVEYRMSWKATSSLGALLSLQPRMAQRLRGDNKSGFDEVDVRFLRVGDLIQTRVGERFAADGKVVEGESEVDESLLTGESLPVSKKMGSLVVAGSLNLSAPIVYQTEKVGYQSRLGEIVAFVERTRLSKAPIQRLADQVSAIFVPVILALSVITFCAWFFIFKSEFMIAMNAAVSVLVVACPCALGLATPIAIALATTRAAQLGILFRDLAALESLQAVDALVLDKTGTLTMGKLRVVEEHHIAGSKVTDALYAAIAALERSSLHPVATAIVDAVEEKNGSLLLPQINARREIIGQGVEGELELEGLKQTLWIGQPNAQEMNVLPDLPAVTWVVCRLNGELILAFALTDTLRPDAHELVSELRQLQINPVLLSGDRALAVSNIANTLGLEFHAEQTPQMKASYIAGVQKNGQRVAMLGDGVNDAPALAQADVGIAVSSGTDAARDTAAVTLKTPNLMGVLTAFQLSKSTFKNIRQNLFWAFAYNVVLIPLAMAGKLTPMWAAAAMVFSSLFVVLNSLRLLRFENLKAS